MECAAARAFGRRGRGEAHFGGGSKAAEMTDFRAKKSGQFAARGVCGFSRG